LVNWLSAHLRYLRGLVAARRVEVETSRTAFSAILATASIIVAGYWRLAVLAVLIAGLILATRLRFAFRAATALLIAVAVIAIAGQVPAQHTRVHSAFAQPRERDADKSNRPAGRR
jgi:hypothetical protein